MANVVDLSDFDLKLKDLGFEFHVSGLAELGKPLLFTESSAFGPSIFIHPIDAFWVDHDGTDIFETHDRAMKWILEEADRKFELLIKSWEYIPVSTYIPKTMADAEMRMNVSDFVG